MPMLDAQWLMLLCDDEIVSYMIQDHYSHIVKKRYRLHGLRSREDEKRPCRTKASECEWVRQVRDTMC
eukprot:6174994-Pleurochrysis_carterae.AAC.1